MRRRDFLRILVLGAAAATVPGWLLAADAPALLFRTRPGGCVRLGDWKLHEYFEDGGLELYNLKDDVGERNDLAEKMPQKTKELHKIMLRWRKELSAPVPAEKNPRYDPKYDKPGAAPARRRKGKGRRKKGKKE